MLKSAPLIRILVVDDDADNRRIISRTLIDAGYVVDTANDGEECLTKLRSFAADLVILDVLMPKMGGFEACRRMRERDELQGIPVLFLTAVEEHQAADAALRSGGDDYLPKPFRRLQLLMRVQNLLALSAQFRAMDRNLRAAQAERDILLRTQTQQQLVTSMAVHDLKGPLAAVVSNASFLHETVATPDHEPYEAINDVIRAAERMKRIIGEALTKSAEGALVADLQAVSFKDMTQQLVRAERGMSIATTLAAGGDNFVADREILERVLENLVDNARKYAPGSMVFIEAERVGDVVEIRVRDEGPGIPASDRELVFQPHKRLARDQATSVSESAGLGLAFCRMALEAHAGTIHVEENVPHGACFVLRIPQHPMHTANRDDTTALRTFS